MQLLFQTESTAGNTELKNLLGFIDADLKISSIKSDLITASRTIYDLVGKDVYEHAVQLYAQGETADANKPFIFAMRYPIAVDAYLKFAPNNDLAHTNNGRRMRVDDKTKPAFEHMIESDNNALSQRYYRAVEDLLRFLDDSSDELSSKWKESEAYKKHNSVLVNKLSDFDEAFPVASRLLLIKLRPGLAICERNEIAVRVPQEKMSQLKAGTELSNDDKKLLLEIKNACIYYAMAWALPRLSVNIFPEGVLQAYVSDRMTLRASKAPMKSETEYARQAFMQDAETCFLNIERMVAVPPTPSTGENSPLDSFVTGDSFFST